MQAQQSLLALTLTMMLAQEPATETDQPVVVTGESPQPTPSPSPTPRSVGSHGAGKTSRATKSAPKPKLICSPRVSISGGLTPSLITVTLIVSRPDERFWCPGIEWYVGSQFTGGHESDCPPYETVVAGEGVPNEWAEDSPRYFRLWPGEHTIRARLTKAGKVLASPECTVYVR